MQRFKWFGILLVATEWAGFITMMAIRTIDTSLPISQYGAYPETKLLFTATLVGAAVFAGLFGIYLQKHHNRSFIIAIAASASFAWTGLTTYNSSYLLLSLSHWTSAIFSGFFYGLLIVVVEKSKGPNLVRTIFLVSTVALILFAVAIAVFAPHVSLLLLFEMVSIISGQLWLALSSFDNTKPKKLV